MKPTDFTLPDSAGKSVSLRSFLRRNRIVLAFAPSRTYLNGVQKSAAGFTERDLVVLAIVPPDSPLAKERFAPPIHVLIDTDDRRVARLYGQAFYLIGKDTNIVAARRDFLSNDALFRQIDAMPMRRDEMRARRSGAG